MYFLESNSFKYVGHAESSFSTLFLAILIFHVVQVAQTTWCRWPMPSIPPPSSAAAAGCGPCCRDRTLLSRLLISSR